MRIVPALLATLTLQGYAFAQVATNPSAVDYMYVNGRQVPLTVVPDAPFYRIHSDARVAATESAQADLQRVMDVREVRPGAAQLAIRRTADSAVAARQAISRYTRIQEADQLRVFTAGRGTTLLIEYPEIILQCDERVTLEEVQRYLRQHYQVTVVPTGLRQGQFLVRVVTPSHTLWLANQLRSTTAIPVRYADVNFFFARPSGSNPPRFLTRWPALSPTPPTNDPGFAEQWALENRAALPGALRGADMGFARAYRIAPLDATGTKIAVLDYAIDVNHPELKSAIDSVFNATRYDPDKGFDDPALRELDFDEQPEAQADHGTAAAGIIAALSGNGVGVSGVAPGAKIVAIQISRPSDSDLEMVNGLAVAAAFQAADRAGAHVVSLSWGLQFPDPEAYPSIRAEIDALGRGRGNKGILVVSAAGNDTIDIPDPDFPADYAGRASNVIAAGASNWCGRRKRAGQCDEERWSSRFGAQTLFAPGVDILTTTNQRDRNAANALTNYRANFNGTSAATPFVAAAAALVLKQHPTWTADQVRTHLIQTAATLTAGGDARLDVCNALYGASRCALTGP